MLPEVDTTFQERSGLDTLVLPEVLDSGDPILAVVSVPAGCGVLDSVLQERRGDTLHLWSLQSTTIYKRAPCAHGPYRDSVFLGPAGRMLGGVSWVSHVRSRPGTRDTTLVLPVPAIRGS